MKILEGNSGLTLVRESGDARISKESTVTHHMRRLLNERDGGGWTRFYPNREGLTSCRQGVCHRKRGVYYWHERYAIEDAHEEFNKSKEIFYLRARD